MTRIIIAFLFILVCSFNMKAQEGGLSSADNRVLVEKKNNDVKGNPYDVNKWSNGTIHANDGEVLEGMLARFNCESDAIEVLVKTRVIELNKHLYNKATITHIDELGESTVVEYKNGLISNNLDYFKVIYQGENVSFVRKTVARFNEKTVANFGTAQNVKKYVKSTKYYLIKDDALIPIKKNKKSILAALGNDKNIEKYVKKEKLKLKKNREIIQALVYYNNMGK